MPRLVCVCQNLIMKFRPLHLVTLLAAGVLNLSGAVEWPQWRGPTGQGHAMSSGLPTHWNERSNVTWKTSIPGRGWSSPVIDGDQVWLTTAIETASSPEDTARRLKANTADQPLTVLEKVEYRAICLDRRSGRIVRDILLLTEREPQWVHKLNSYASPTPIIEPGRLYAHFGASGNVCVDTKIGQVIWTNSTLQIMHENGPGSSPVLWRNLLIFHMDGSDRQYVAALDTKTGQLAWKTNRTGKMNDHPQLKKSYATPLILSVDGQDQIISPGPDWLYAYDPASGRELWKIKYGNLGFSLSARPVVGHGMIYLSTGFMRPEMLAIRFGGGKPPEIAWRYAKGVPTMSSPLLVGDELFFVSDSGGMLTCLDARTGYENYRERLGGEHNASPLHADHKIYISDRAGVTAVITGGKTFQLLAKNDLAGKIMASQAVADRAIFLRTDTALYRLEESSRNAVQ